MQREKQEKQRGNQALLITCATLLGAWLLVNTIGHEERFTEIPMHARKVPASLLFTSNLGVHTSASGLSVGMSIAPAQQDLAGSILRSAAAYPIITAQLGVWSGRYRAYFRSANEPQALSAASYAPNLSILAGLEGAPKPDHY